MGVPWRSTMEVQEVEEEDLEQKLQQITGCTGIGDVFWLLGVKSSSMFAQLTDEEYQYCRKFIPLKRAEAGHSDLMNAALYGVGHLRLVDKLRTRLRAEAGRAARERSPSDSAPEDAGAAGAAAVPDEPSAEAQPEEPSAEALEVALREAVENAMAKLSEAQFMLCNDVGEEEGTGWALQGLAQAKHLLTVHHSGAAQAAEALGWTCMAASQVPAAAPQVPAEHNPTMVEAKPRRRRSSKQPMQEVKSPADAIDVSGHKCRDVLAWHCELGIDPGLANDRRRDAIIALATAAAEAACHTATEAVAANPNDVLLCAALPFLQQAITPPSGQPQLQLVTQVLHAHRWGVGARFLIRGLPQKTHKHPKTRPPPQNLQIQATQTEATPPSLSTGACPPSLSSGHDQQWAQGHDQQWWGTSDWWRNDTEWDASDWHSCRWSEESKR